MAPHGHDGESPMHKEKPKLDLSFDPKEREGLTSAEVEGLYQIHGYNELPVVEIPLWWVFLQQYMGTMPYMLEIAIIIAGATQDWADFGIILAMLNINASVGFYEELKAAQALAKLTDKMEKKIATLRDGKADHLLTRLLVPGDVVLLIGGAEVPADIEWLEGDILSIDTAALTGEPLPRKYPSDQYGKLILCGSTVKAGEAYGIVRKTGTNTEIGAGQADIMQDKAHTKCSVFEDRILLTVRIIIFISVIDVIIILLVIGLGIPHLFSLGPGTIYGYPETATGVSYDFDIILSIIIASIPIALPLVLQVTMALGAGKMATDFDAVVTSIPALQDISSMTVLCSDKTGTLTTAKITIHAESVWTCGEFTKEDVALFGGLSSSRDKKEDAIDRSVIKHFDKVFGQGKAMQMASEYKKIRGVGFNPIYKRVLFEFSNPKYGTITIAKGLPNKVLDTADGTADDAEDQWKCEDFENLKDVIKKVDFDFSKAGYKTLGVAIKIGNGPFRFVGVLPMLDPPRHDTMKTIKNLVAAGIEVKMITGDHLNIAKETARLIGMGVNIHAGEEVRDNSATRDQLVLDSNGFAQVLPKDKREVVLVLKERYKYVVGMTGDGVNDAPALSAAQVGVAVDDATDAAKNAAAIILTAPGLSAIYSGVVESRRIFRKLKSYVVYRFAATIQIVTVLTLLIYINQCSINSTFIVILALFNDVSMLPIAYDLQQASSTPENPDVVKLLLTSFFLGCLETGLTLLFAYGAGPSGLTKGSGYLMTKGGPPGIGGCGVRLQALIWIQMFVASEILIFSARAPSYIWVSLRPSPALFVSVFGCNVIASILCGQATLWGFVETENIVLTWLYCMTCLVFIDYCRVFMLGFFHENLEVLADEEYVRSIDENAEGEEHAAPGSPEATDRGSVSANRLTDWAVSKSERLSSMDPAQRDKMAADAKIRNSSVGQDKALNGSATSDRASFNHAQQAGGSQNSLRPSIITSGSLRPNVPSSNPKGIKIKG